MTNAVGAKGPADAFRDARSVAQEFDHQREHLACEPLGALFGEMGLVRASVARGDAADLCRPGDITWTQESIDIWSTGTPSGMWIPDCASTLLINARSRISMRQ